MIRIYLASLYHYNCGELRGQWIDLPCDNLQERIDQILAGQEEYAIHDYESDIPHHTISEHDNPFTLNEQAELLSALNEDDISRLSYLLYDGEDLADALTHYDDVTCYPDMDLEGLAREFVDEGVFGEVNDTLKSYIDYQRLGNDLSHDGYTELDGNVYIRND